MFTEQRENEVHVILPIESFVPDVLPSVTSGPGHGTRHDEVRVPTFHEAFSFQSPVLFSRNQLLLLDSVEKHDVGDGEVRAP